MLLFNFINSKNESLAKFTEYMHIVAHAFYKPHRWNKKLNYEEIFSCQEIYSHLFLNDTGVLFTNSQVISASLNKGLHSQKFARAWNIQVLNYVLTIPGVALINAVEVMKKPGLSVTVCYRIKGGLLKSLRSFLSALLSC